MLVSTTEGETCHFETQLLPTQVLPCGAVRDLLSRYSNRQLSESNWSTLRTTCRAFSATAQMESDAIRAGLITKADILSTQQVTKW